MVPGLTRRSRTGGVSRLTKALTAAVATLVYAGCSPATVPDPVLPSVPPYDAWRPSESRASQGLTDAERKAGRQRYLKKLADAYKLKNPPHVALVRFVGRDEWPSVIAQCYTDSGFPAEASDDGGIAFLGAGVVSSQKSAFDAVDWDCQSRYTLDPVYDTEFTDDQLGVIWEYNSSWLGLCLATHGYPTAAGPSRATYIAGFRSGKRWDPLEEALAKVRTTSEDQALRRDCPRYPSTAALYGS